MIDHVRYLRVGHDHHVFRVEVNEHHILFVDIVEDKLGRIDILDVMSTTSCDDLTVDKKTNHNHPGGVIRFPPCMYCYNFKIRLVAFSKKMNQRLIESIFCRAIDPLSPFCEFKGVRLSKKKKVSKSRRSAFTEG